MSCYVHFSDNNKTVFFFLAAPPHLWLTVSPHLTCWLALLFLFPPCPEENSFLLMCTIRAQRVLAKGLFLGLCIIVASTRVCVMAFTRRWNPSPFPNVFVSWKARGGPHHISDLDEKVDVSLVSNDNYFWRHSKEELKRAGISRRKIERKKKKKTTGDNKRKLRTRENDGRTGRSYFADSCHTHTHRKTLRRWERRFTIVARRDGHVRRPEK